jgi:hypothetical protein
MSEVGELAEFGGKTLAEASRSGTCDGCVEPERLELQTFVSQASHLVALG